jgi:hypothetical protein
MAVTRDTAPGPSTRPRRARVSGFEAAVRRGRRVLVGVLALYVGLVATHRGEFWPFSIYPMFSLAGRPWTRAVTRAVPVDHRPDWEPVEQLQLPGDPFALTPRGIGNNDVANFVAKTQRWDPERIAGLRRLFADELQDRALMFYAARGELDDRVDGGVRIRFVPVILLRPDGYELRPDLLDGGAAI